MKSPFPHPRRAAAGLLQARPSSPITHSPPGLYPLGLESQRDGLLYVPSGYSPERATPLILMLHGAGGDAEAGIRLVKPFADSFGTILLAVDSRQRTWDVILGDYGPDITFMDRALSQTFSQYSIDPSHLAIAGFSDGASYALSVGMMNGDLFSHVIAFSPGFMSPAGQQGMPQFFISHGIDDEVLSIERCSRRIVPTLQRAGYIVYYQEFNGSHTVPGAIARQAFDWFLHASP